MPRPDNGRTLPSVQLPLVGGTLSLPTVADMVDGRLAVVRGGERLQQMIALDRTGPGALDRRLAAG